MMLKLKFTHSVLAIIWGKKLRFAPSVSGSNPHFGKLNRKVILLWPLGLGIKSRVSTVAGPALRQTLIEGCVLERSIDAHFSCKQYPYRSSLSLSLSLQAAFIHRLNFELGDMNEGQGTSNLKKWNVLIIPCLHKFQEYDSGGVANMRNQSMRLVTVASCYHLKLPFKIEIDKAYRRDFMQSGRVRVLLKREDGTLCNTAISSRKQLMFKLHI